VVYKNMAFESPRLGFIMGIIYVGLVFGCVNAFCTTGMNDLRKVGVCMFECTRYNDGNGLCRIRI
jgi:hypothetical protein